jgi:hypothetical protein
MGSISTLAAEVRVVILSPYKWCQNRPILCYVPAHGDLNALVGEDEGGVGGSEFGLQDSSAIAQI